jgi:hypothetical protein
MTGDTLRPSKGGEFGNQNSNIFWFYNLLRHQLFRATGLPVKVAYCFDQISFENQFSGLPDGVCLDSWAKLYCNPTQHLEGLWEKEFTNSLVIGFELPPSLRAFLTRNGIPFVDAMLHPVRFMDDIFFCFSSNRDDVESGIRNFELDRQRVYDAAGLIQATVSRQSPLTQYENGSVLYAAQTSVDRSMISDGVFFRSEDIGERVASTLVKRPVVYKDHPLERTPSIRQKIQSSCSSFSTTTENIYRLLCSSEIKTVLSVSSSVGHEAIFFDKSAEYVKSLSTPVRYSGDNQDLGYGSVFNEFLSEEFWRVILSPVLNTGTLRVSKPVIPNRPNLLRNSLGVYWGYDLFGCDPIIRNSSVNFSKDIPHTMRLLKLSESLLSSRFVNITLKKIRAMVR